MNPKESIVLDTAYVFAITQHDKNNYSKLDLDKSFKVVFDSNCYVGCKKVEKPQPAVWFFTLSTKEERDEWVIFS